MKRQSIAILFILTSLFGFAQCPAPTNFFVSATTVNSVTLTWIGGGSTEWQIQYAPIGFTIGNGTTVNVTTNPTTISNIAGATTYHAYVRDTCASTSSVSSWYGPITFTTGCTGAMLAPIDIDFETSNWVQSANFNDPGTIASCWINNPTTGFMYTVGPPVFPPFGSGPSGDHTTGNGNYLVSDRIGFTSSNTQATIRTPRIDISNITNPEISVWYHLFGNQISEFKIEAKNANGGPWTILKSFSGQQHNSKTDPWDEAVASLNSLNADTVFIRFVAINTGSTAQNANMAIDDFSIYEGPTCPAPSDVKAVSKGSNSITVGWLSGGASNWQIEYGVNPFVQGNGTKINVSTNPFKVTGLLPSTTYRFYVRDSCTSTDQSFWKGPLVSNTECLESTTPYTENFDGTNFTVPPNFGSNGTIDICWTRSSTTGYFWETGEAPFPSNSTGPSSDHTTGSGNYMFTDRNGFTSVPATTNLKTELIDLSSLTVPELSFWYHMFGSGIGSLYVDINDGNGWTSVFNKIGQQQTSKTDAWKEAIIDLSAYANDTIQIRFKAITTINFNNEISIDDVDIHEKPSCPKPSLLASSSTTTTTANLNWTTGGATNWLVKYSSGTPTIVSTNSNPFVLSGLTASTTYDVWVKDSCSVGDVSDWIGPISITTQCNPSIAPYTEDFESAVWVKPITFNQIGTIDPCYNRSNNGIFVWNPGPPPFASFNSGPSGDHTTGSGKYMFSDGIGFVNNQEIATFLTPLIDLSPLTIPELTFWYHMFGSDIHSFRVEIATATGWTVLYTKTGQQHISKTDPWKEAVIDLTSYANDTIQLRFVSKTNPNFAFNVETAIDDIAIKEKPTCPKPSNLAVITAFTNSITIDWTTGGATNWLVKHQTGTGTPVISGTNNNPHVISGLLANTTYSIWVKDSCSAGDVSDWVGPITVSTECTATVLPYTEDFESANWVVKTNNFFPGTIDNCWSRSDTATYFWNVGNGISGTFNGSGPTGDHTTGSGKFMFGAYNNAFVAQATDLQTPWLDLSGVGSPELEFYYHMFGSDINSLKIVIIELDGSETNLDSLVGQQQTTAATAWSVKSLSLSAFAGDTVKVKFVARKLQGFRSEIAIDDIKVYDIVCSDPTGLQANNITSTSADISWTGGAPQSNIEYDLTGFTLGTGNTINDESSVFNLTGLLPFTSYDLYVQDSCAQGNSSSWVGPITFITDCQQPAAGFTFTNNGLTVSFDGSNATGSNLTLDWTYGDGNVGQGTNVSNTYTSAGTYTVQLVVTDACGYDDTLNQTITVCDPPVAAFTYSVSGTTVSFDANPSQGAVSYFWDFSNGVFSALATPSVTFSTFGTYNILLVVTNACGDVDSLLSSIIVCEKPQASFTYNVLSSGGSGMVVNFDGSSSIGATSYFWDFGDGTTNNVSAIPQHTYSVPGLFYEITLIVTNTCGGSDTLKIKMSDIFSVEDEILSEISVFPNPTQDMVYLDGIEGNWEDIDLSLVSLKGEVIALEVQNFENSKGFDMSELPSGVYFLQLNLSGVSRMIKIVKE